VSTALILISTTEDDVPVIIESPERFPFAPGERELYREATDDEYDHWYHWYMGYQDFTDPPTSVGSEVEHVSYKAGWRAAEAEGEKP
jgi:hypothetical protein